MLDHVKHKKEVTGSCGRSRYTFISCFLAWHS